MRLLIVGGGGMLGHRLVRTLGATHEVYATVRASAAADALTAAGVRDEQRDARTVTIDAAAADAVAHATADATAPTAPPPTFITGLDVRDAARVAQLLDTVRPDAVINAVGIVKQRRDEDVATFIEVNALFPHTLAAACRARGARLILLSTDCVFSGARGGYREDDPPDATDVYGQTKRLGEVIAPGVVTLRTSMIGLEPGGHVPTHGLIEWFLAQQGVVTGFRRARFSGLTTAALADLIGQLLVSHPQLHGLWHVAAEPIDKYDLLHRLSARLPPALERTVRPDDTFACDRSLCGDAFRDATGWVAPDWDHMLDDLAHEIEHRWLTGTTTGAAR